MLCHCKFQVVGTLAVLLSLALHKGLIYLTTQKNAYDSLIGQTRLCQHERNPLLQ